MDALPNSITKTHLWQRLSLNADLQYALKNMRATANVIAGKIEEVLPDYTDHSFVHMDALWGITDQVFTEAELNLFSPGEAFILACAFYTHDIGMALAATPAGLAELEASTSFQSTFDRLTKVTSFDAALARELALSDAARELHAEKAEKFIDESFPGLDRFIIESKQLREQWGSHIGQVAASHHWSIQKVDKKLGIRGRIPDSIGGEIDLGVVACALRIIDCAHINADRAPSLDRVLRSSISSNSLKHWNAQEHITGPTRDETVLVYGSTRPVKDLDGWWTFYEMASGLDREIASVNDYLSSRASSTNRFSLEGVKGADTPKRFAVYVPTDGFEPVDLNFRPDSMERLIELLGGQTLYGRDYFAPIRELLQNARDAIMLQKATSAIADYTTEPGEIKVSVRTLDDRAELTVSDNGVGMSERIISNYLLGIASDYWHSTDFFSEYPGVLNAGFGPAGRFGIGFLSVFMLGEQITVETQKRGDENLILSIRGVGRRGSLQKQNPKIKAGTSVRVQIPREIVGNFDNLDEVVRAKAPMLEVPVFITQQQRTIEIKPGWWKTASQGELLRFLAEQRSTATRPRRETHGSQSDDQNNEYRTEEFYQKPNKDIFQIEERGWPGRQPEAVGDSFRILAVPVFRGHVLICSRGFAIDTVSIPGMVGLTEIGEVQVDAARSTTLEWDEDSFRAKLIDLLKPRIREALDGLQSEFSIHSRQNFLRDIGKVYGEDVLIDTKLRWISIIEAPGTVELVSPETLRQRLVGREAFVVFGNGSDLWECAKICQVCFPEMSRSALLVPVNTAGQPDVGSYQDQEESFRNRLPDHFFDLYSMGDYGDATLLRATLRIVAQAINKSYEEIVEMQWVRHRQTVVLRLPATGA